MHRLVLVAALLAGIPPGVAAQTRPENTPQTGPQTEKKSTAIDVGKVSPEDRARLAGTLKEHGLAPVDYVVGTFRDHEVVLLGETHGVQETCRFVADLVEPLYRRAGVRQLASEFIRSRNTDRVNRLVTAPEFDEARAVAIQRDGPWPTWGYQEYLDILRAVWKLNRGLPAGAERFRVAGLDSDWDQYDLWFTHRQDPRKRFNIQLERESNMAHVVETEAFEKKRKTLVHVGWSHSILCHGVRLGTVLHKKYGERLFQVAMHRLDTVGRGRKPARITRFLEEIHRAAGGRPAGFDVVGSPLANLVDSETMWSRARKDARFGHFHQGYVILKPLAELHEVHWVKGFITDAMFEKALAVAEKARYVKPGTCKDAASLDRILAQRFRGQLKSESESSK